MMIPMKHTAKFINGAAFKPKDWGEKGKPIIRIAQLTGKNFDNYFDGSIDKRYYVENGDLLFSWSATLDSFIWNRGDALLNQHIFKVEPFKGIFKKYLFYSLKHYTKIWADIDAHGSTMQHIKKESLGNKIWLPDYRVQKEVADFLDGEITHIDLLIEKKEKLLSLLQERFISLKNQAITKGISKDFSFVSTNQEFCPTMPTHWSIEKLKYSLLKIEQGWSPQAENRAIKDGQWGVLKVGCVNNGFYDCSQHKALPPGVEPQKKLEVREGDILMSRGNSLNLVGSVGLVKETLPNLMISDLLYRLYFDQRKISTDFATYALSSHYIRKQIELSASGSSDTMPKISQSKIKSFLWVLPTIEEQEQIVSYLDRSLQLINDASKKCEYSCDLLKQLKASLITEAVTGQLDIKSWKKRGGTDKRLDNIEEAMRT